MEYTLPTALVFVVWNLLLSDTLTTDNFNLGGVCTCDSCNELLQLTFILFLRLFLLIRVADGICITECCRRGCETDLLCINSESQQDTTKKHGKFSCSCSCIGMSLIDGYPLQTLCLGVYELFVLLPQQYILQHGWVGKQDVRTFITHILTGI